MLPGMLPHVYIIQYQDRILKLCHSSSTLPNTPDTLPILELHPTRIMVLQKEPSVFRKTSHLLGQARWRNYKKLSYC